MDSLDLPNITVSHSDFMADFDTANLLNNELPSPSSLLISNSPTAADTTLPLEEEEDSASFMKDIVGPDQLETSLAASVAQYVGMSTSASNSAPANGNNESPERDQAAGGEGEGEGGANDNSRGREEEQMVSLTRERNVIIMPSSTEDAPRPGSVNIKNQIIEYSQNVICNDLYLFF